MACVQVRDGVITLLEAWVQVSSPERVLPGLADYLTSPKAAMAEGKVLCLSRDIPSPTVVLVLCGGTMLGLRLTVTIHDMHVQAAAIQWARGAMLSGHGAACLESAVRVASLGVLDKGAETREAGTALMLVLAQVGAAHHWPCAWVDTCFKPFDPATILAQSASWGWHVAGVWQGAHHSGDIPPCRACQEGSQRGL